MNAKVIVKPFDETNLADAKLVVGACFSERTCRQIESALHCPSRRNGWPAGCIAYEDGKPKAFQALFWKRAFVGGQECHVAFMGCLCRMDDASLESLIAVVENTGVIGRKAELLYGNTACESAAKLNALFGPANSHGPGSWEVVRFGRVSVARSLLYGIRRKCFPNIVPESCVESGDWAFRIDGVTIARAFDIQPATFDFLDKRLRETICGFVCSRNADELKWTLDGKLRAGKIVVLIARDAVGACGYIVLEKKDAAYGPLRWFVDDCVAVVNDRRILHALCCGALHFLRKKTNAIELLAQGFSDYANEVLRGCLPNVVRMTKNPFMYGFPVAATSISAELNNRDSWFFGPYDGDAVLN